MGKTKVYKYVSTCKNILIKMGKDRKHMRKLRKKRMKSTQEQIDKHKQKIEQESGRKDTTKDYWKKEIDEKFSKQMEEDKEYLKED